MADLLSDDQAGFGPAPASTPTVPTTKSMTPQTGGTPSLMSDADAGFGGDEPEATLPGAPKTNGLNDGADTKKQSATDNFMEKMKKSYTGTADQFKEAYDTLSQHTRGWGQKDPLVKGGMLEENKDATVSQKGLAIMGTVLSTVGTVFDPVVNAISAYGTEPVLGKGEAADWAAVGLSLLVPVGGAARVASKATKATEEAAQAEKATAQAAEATKASEQAANVRKARVDAVAAGRAKQQELLRQQELAEAKKSSPEKINKNLGVTDPGDAASASRHQEWQITPEDVRATFKNDAEIADYYRDEIERKALHEQTMTAREEAAQKAHEAANTIDTAAIKSGHAPENIPWSEVLPIYKKPGFERSAVERVRMRQYERQSGGANAALLARVAAAGIGGVTGAYMDPENPIGGAIMGTMAGLTVTRIPYSQVWKGVKNYGPQAAKAIFTGKGDLFGKDMRLRMDEQGNAHEYEIAAGTRSTGGVQHAMEQHASSEASMTKVTHHLDGDKSVQLTPQEQKAADIAKKHYAEIFTRGKEAGILDEAWNDYVTHLWVKDKKYADFMKARAAGPSMSTTSSFAKERTIASLKEGKAAGLTPVTENASQLVGVYSNSMNRAIANKNLIDTLKMSKNKFLIPGDKAPSDYVSLNHPQLQGLKVHPDIAPSMKFLFDSKEPGAALRATIALNMATKRAQVAASLFHVKTLFDASVASSGGLITGPIKGVANAAKIVAQSAAPKIFGTNKYIKMLRQGGAGDLVDDALQGGVKIAMTRGGQSVDDVSGHFYDGMQVIKQGLDAAIPFGGKIFEKFLAANHKFDEFMWENLHPAMKLHAFSYAQERLLQKFPDLPRTKVNQISASYANDLFGGMNWRRIAEGVQNKYGRDIMLQLFSPSGRQVAQGLVFAPDWDISTTRAMAKAAGGVFSDKETAYLHRMYLARSAMYFLTAGNALNLAFSGKWLWENKPQGKEPTTSDGINAMTFIDMGDGRRMAFSKHTTDPIHLGTEFSKEALGKLSYAVKETADQLQGQEYATPYKTKIPMDTSATGRLKHALGNALPMNLQGMSEKSASTLAWSALGMPVYGKNAEEKQKHKENLDKAKMKKAQDLIDQAMKDAE